MGTMRRDNPDREELGQESLREMFYDAKGNLDDVNRAIDAKLQKHGARKITLFEEFIKNRLALNPSTLRMARMEITPMEAVYLSLYPAIKGLEVLDLRKNHIEDAGLEAIAQSPLFSNLKELDLRNNGITRLGMKVLAESEFLGKLEKLDLRSNQLSKRWEEKLKETGRFSNLNELKIV